MQLRFDPAADRLLWQLRTFGGELFAIWLTRRLMCQLWPLLQGVVTSAGIARLMPHATLMPEAREMLSQAVRQRPLASAEFGKPFNTEAAAQPLGAEPLLPVHFQLTHGTPGAGLALELRETAGRSLKLQLSDDLATALTRLLEPALQEADWGLHAVPTEPGAPAMPVTLN